MLDIYEYCLTTASKPLYSEMPSKRAYLAQSSVKVLGGAGNAAQTLASLGARVSMVGVAGNDEHYFKLRSMCDQSRINHSIIRDKDRQTTTKARLFIDDKYLLRRDDECIDPINHSTQTAVLNESLHVLSDINVVILSDYNKGVFSEDLAQQIISECRVKGIPVIVDFKPCNASKFRGADVLSTNERDAKDILPSFNQSSLYWSTVDLFSELYGKAVVVTLGGNGICGYDGAMYFHVAGHKVPVRDPVGCGDTVRAGIALGLTLGLDLKGAASLANYAAAVVASKANTATITCSELMAFICKAEG